MKIPLTKIELACEKKANRYILNAVKYDVEGKRIIATDGYIVAVVPVEVEDGDVSCLIPVNAVTAMRKAKLPKVTLNGHVRIDSTDGSQEFTFVTGQYPNVDAAMPSGEDYAGEPTITLDAEQLLRLAKAIRSGDSAAVSLWIKDASSVVLVRGGKESEAFGAIMPKRR